MMLRERLFIGGRAIGIGAVADRDRLNVNDRLNAGEELHAGGGRLVMQTDGNLVIYKPDGSALWSSYTNGKPITYLEMQTDGNLVAYDNARRAYWSSRTQGNAGAYATFQADGNFVIYSSNGRPLWSSKTWEWKKHEDTGNVFTQAARAVSSAVKSVEKVPVLGNVVNIVDEASSAPFKFASSIASGARIDRALMGELKDQLKIAKDVAPYAQTVVSLVPGIGTGAAAAIAAGAALAEGKSIDEATKAAIRGALPGGALSQAAFDTAMKVAAGERIDHAALESARSMLSPGPQQAAFDVGVAVLTGEKIQNAVAKGLASMAPSQVQSILAAGANALATTPGLADALKQVPPGVQEEGFKLAAGLLSQAGMSQKGVTEVRNRLDPETRQGFDAALKSQEPHVAWLKNVTAPVPTSPPQITPPAPARQAPVLRAPTRVAAGKYGPYPPFAKTRTAGLGAVQDDTGSGATPWIAGGLLVGLAIGVFMLEKKGPAPVRRSA